MDKYKEQLLPAFKIALTENDVIEVKKIVDEMIKQFLNSINKQTKSLTEKFILSSAQIPFYISEEGHLTIGIRNKEIF